MLTEPSLIRRRLEFVEELSELCRKHNVRLEVALSGELLIEDGFAVHELAYWNSGAIFVQEPVK